MKIEELKKKGNVTVTEVKNGCVKVSADKGFILKGGDTYTSEIYCDKDAELQDYEVVAYSDYLRAENKKKYEGKTIEEAKEMLLAEIEAYDTSSAVNGFSLNNTVVWLDKATRVGLMNSTSITKAMGQPTTTLWLGESKMEVPCDTAIQLLSALEMYALECFNVTAAHKKAVSELTTIGEVEKYDITAGYPAQLKMEV
uniref:DUF4376 domain-containing protein n=1 Tax=Siphoviridae sp. ctMOb8 TaxID=2825460 RepID=A0A8S5Q125_9CAUD|nr:MAG TPA: protein of unknown function (DUF4376) [Siphoviridae sp. ctMOb8]